jgi:hypothetical protein
MAARTTVGARSEVGRRRTRLASLIAARVSATLVTPQTRIARP